MSAQFRNAESNRLIDPSTRSSGPATELAERPRNSKEETETTRQDSWHAELAQHEFNAELIMRLADQVERREQPFVSERERVMSGDRVRERDHATNSTEETNKCVVRRLMQEVLGDGRLDLLTDLVSPDYVAHLSIGDHYGPGGERLEMTTYRNAFPDLKVTLNDLLCDGDRVVRRFTVDGTHLAHYLGFPPSGLKTRLRGIAIDRVENGQLVESWVVVETPQQLSNQNTGRD